MNRRAALKAVSALGIGGLAALVMPGLVRKAYAYEPSHYAMDDKEREILSKPEVRDYFQSRKENYRNWSFLNLRKRFFDEQYNGLKNAQTKQYDPSKFNLKEFQPFVDNYRNYDDIMPLMHQLFELVNIPNVVNNERAARSYIIRARDAINSKQYPLAKLFADRAVRFAPNHRIPYAYASKADRCMGNLYEALSNGIKSVKLDMDDDGRGLTTDSFTPIAMVFFANGVQEAYKAGLKEAQTGNKGFSKAQHYFKLWDVTFKKSIEVTSNAGRDPTDLRKAYNSVKARIDDCSKYFGVDFL